MSSAGAKGGCKLQGLISDGVSGGQVRLQSRGSGRSAAPPTQARRATCRPARRGRIAFGTVRRSGRQRARPPRGLSCHRSRTSQSACSSSWPPAAAPRLSPALTATSRASKTTRASRWTFSSRTTTSGDRRGWLRWVVTGTRGTLRAASRTGASSSSLQSATFQTFSPSDLRMIGSGSWTKTSTSAAPTSRRCSAALRRRGPSCCSQRSSTKTRGQRPAWSCSRSAASPGRRSASTRRPAASATSAS
mmetsp:Transcript_143184/g.399085  ORF Transcript_143184/g.399085 Transcript_143184/m.399085 type:complete len:247 (-) Transcript_143184:464-1204(-)